MDLSNFWWQSGAATPVGIGNSLRFRGAQKLARTNGTSTNPSVTTTSWWMKKATTGDSTNHGLILYYGGFPYESYVNFRNGAIYGNKLTLLHYSNGDAGTTEAQPLLRDPSAWYHCVLVTNGAKAATWYINGVQVPVNTTGDFGIPMWNAAGPLLLGNTFNGYMAEFHLVDGTALDATSFGEFNADGVWVPKKVTLTKAQYGTNGFHLAFDDVTQIGKDSSGNNNHFTPTGFELTTTTSPNYDLVKDSPTDNYATLNPLEPSNKGSLVNGNLKIQPVSDAAWAASSLLVSSASAKSFYYEAEYTGGPNLQIGLSNPKPGAGFLTNLIVLVQNDGAATATISGAGAFASAVIAQPSGATVAGSVVGVTYNPTAGTVQFTNNGAAFGSVTGLAKVDVCPMLGRNSSTGPQGTGYDINYGQRPFRHQPAGTVAWSTAGLPSVPIKNPSDHFTTILDTGANILTKAQAKFPHGLWWIKDRANSNNHQLVDSVRGSTNVVLCPSTAGETAYAAPAGNSVAWCWSAPEAFSSSAGSAASSGRRNVEAGFSVVSYTGTGTLATVGHGLSQPLDLILFFNRGVTPTHKDVYCREIGADKRLQLSTTLAASSSSGFYNNTDPTSQVFTVNTDKHSNGSGDNMVAYCWHSVPGYSAFGKYVGNGNPDGPFVYTGFRPAFVMIKKSTGPASWQILDALRNTYNPAQTALFPSDTRSEVNNSDNSLDMLSNGFKLRGNGDTLNQTQTYIYCAFAEHPFGGANVAPATAR